ncbi:MBL fold metallo-hydrolase [Lysinibacillus fusiformis]|uniref:MBL fold metallo-hydrolase n=1 Tax=Lysinibacillus fusiformis TaxID=28031 RepID=UPI0019673FFF|nr:MBL fold metallo-hydrolase [Lysinibacillus fusiformis]QSB09622.1 MBL fold metallo-hydrolase [Lysinibacillus fusiformis]
MSEYYSRHFNLEKVSEGIYAAIAKDGGGAFGNAGVIDLGDKTIIFDTFNTQQAAEDLRNIAVHITNKPVSWVINSHFHSDHTRGNQVFKDCHIVSSQITLQQMKENHPAKIAEQKADLEGLKKYIASLVASTDIQKMNEISFLKEMESSIPDLELVLPQYTFTHEFTISGTERTARIMTLGGGHSPCDSFLYIPEDEIIFMADLLFVGMHPSFFPYSNPTQWENILEEVNNLAIQKAIPGHGSVGSKKDIVKLKNYINEMNLLSKKIRNMEDVSIPTAYQDWTTIHIDVMEFVATIYKERQKR